MNNFNVGQIIEMNFNYLTETERGIPLIYLSYGDKDTYRVKAFPFQVYNPENIPKKILCEVKSIDIVSGLPFLVQEKLNILNYLYSEGEYYPFKVKSIENDVNTNSKFYILEDNLNGLEHRAYFKDNEILQVSDIVSLLIKSIDKEKKILKIELPEIRVQSEPIELTETSSEFGVEDIHTEFKSSIVFYPGDKTPDVDKQLYVIVKTLAAFANAEGGTIWLGVNDRGQVNGIQDDFSFLNNSTEFDRQYKANTDGYELKIRDAISSWCNASLGSYLTIEFYKNSIEKIYCALKQKAVSEPVFLRGNRLYRRAGNQVVVLKNEEITQFIQHKIINNAQLITKMVEPYQPEKKGDTLINTPLEVATKPYIVQNTNEKVEIWNYFTFYKDGKWSFQKDKVNDESVLVEVVILKSNKDKRLILGYDNGCINIVIPTKVKAGKDSRKKYANGWNTNANLIFVSSNDIYTFIVVKSSDSEGSVRVKAHSIAEFNTLENLKAQGSTVANSSLGNVVSYKTVSYDNKNAIPSLIFDRSQASQTLGIRFNEPKYKNEIEFLERI